MLVIDRNDFEQLTNNINLNCWYDIKSLYLNMNISLSPYPHLRKHLLNVIFFRKKKTGVAGVTNRASNWKPAHLGSIQGRNHDSYWRYTMIDQGNHNSNIIKYVSTNICSFIWEKNSTKLASPGLSSRTRRTQAFRSYSHSSIIQWYGLCDLLTGGSFQ